MNYRPEAVPEHSSQVINSCDIFHQPSMALALHWVQESFLWSNYSQLLQPNREITRKFGLALRQVESVLADELAGERENSFGVSATRQPNFPIDF